MIDRYNGETVRSRVVAVFTFLRHFLILPSGATFSLTLIFIDNRYSRYFLRKGNFGNRKLFGLTKSP
ncbi:hypothetical protein DERP_013230 [Dermatophagoides pteronyssinus]|uniref:Uncharacterized protein n=1 Tax=Dermatophagoides pteronyssinus TaxID=6956 RepID=A0ABQ8IRG7_DERPT|nr:hypothetical protein DERP_013230 [Dermatophagoides pteronyssinus]